MDCKKTKYGTEKFALNDLERIRNSKVQREKVPVAVYLCKCGSWHLTSQKNWNVVIAELEAQIKKLLDEKQVLQNEKSELELKNKALQSSIQKAEHKQINSDPRIIALNKTVRKAKDLVRKLRKSNSSLISENLHLKKTL